MSKRPRVIIWSLVTCNLAMMALAITTNLLPVFLTTIASDLGKGTLLSAEQLGRIGAVTFIGLVGGILVTGPLADRWGGRIFAVGGNGLIAMGLATLHWTIDYPMLLGAAFIGGVGGGILDMILSPIVSSLTRGQSQTPALNVLHSFYCVGAIVTILAGSLALRFGLSWRTLALGLLPMPVQVPNLQIDLSTAGWNDYWTKLTLQAASGGMQDIISIQSQRTPQFGAAFQPLDPLVKAENFDLKPFDPTIVAALTLDGALRALPYDFGPYIIFYNKDLFKRDNVQEPKVEWVHDEFLAAAKKLTHGNQYGFAAFPYPDFCFPFVLSDGGSYLNGKGEIDVVNAGFVKAFESYAELVYKQHLAPPLPATQDANTAWSLWAAGNAAMVVSGPWDVVNAKSSVKFDFGLATMPKGSKGSITIAGGSGFGISSSAKDRNLAFKAITALTSDEAEERLASAGRAFPARKAEQASWYKNAPAGSEEVLNRTLNGGVVPFKTTSNWQQFNLLFVQYGIPAMNGQTPAATALQQVQDQLSI